MASTYSPILRIELIGTGEQSGTWGNTTNVNLGTLIEQAIAGTTTVDVTAGNVTLTNFNGSSDQARCAAIRVIGIPGVSRNIVAPAVSKIYVIANGSDADVVLKTSISTGLTVPAGEVFLAYYDPTVGTADFLLVGRASTSANTPNTLVLRNVNGDFSAGIITATLLGNVIGNVTGNLDGNLTATAPTAPTAAPGTNTTQVATTAFVNSANTTGSAGSIANAGGWAITPSGTDLIFSYNGTNVAKLTSAGAITAIDNVTAYGTI
jgi:hypothetical protein